jgi:RimJ/RimL family protein N-acetyltransferase
VPDEIRTRRLVGLRPRPDDAEELHLICTDPRVVRWAFGETPTLAETTTALAKDASHWQQHGFGRWIWRHEHAIVAHAGLLAKGSEVALAWYVAADRWREGIGTEVAGASVRFAFETLRLPALIALTLPDNLASRALMLRLGMHEDGEVDHAGLTHARYRLANPNTQPG